MKQSLGDKIGLCIRRHYGDWSAKDIKAKIMALQEIASTLNGLEKAYRSNLAEEEETEKALRSE